MLDSEERFFLWKKYKENFEALFSDVEWDIFKKYKPYGEVPDKDAPIVEKFFDLLDKMRDFINVHHEDLQFEYDAYCSERTNLQNNFEAWCWGICPKVYNNMTFFERYNHADEIKEFFKDFSLQESERALKLWRDIHRINASA